jgi:hypothetical protein
MAGLLVIIVLIALARRHQRVRAARVEDTYLLHMQDRDSIDDEDNFEAP